MVLNPAIPQFSWTLRSFNLSLRMAGIPALGDSPLGSHDSGLIPLALFPLTDRTALHGNARNSAPCIHAETPHGRNFATMIMLDETRCQEVL